MALVASLTLAGTGVARTLVVHAASSLSGAFQEFARRFEAAHPGVKVVCNFAGTQQLVRQIEGGAPGDVFASADDRWMTYLERKGQLAGPGVPIARNRLVVITPPGDPGHIRSLADLAVPGRKLVLAARAVPAGGYAREMLLRLGRTSGYSPGYTEAVLRNVVSEEDNVRQVVSKVVLGEADAGVVYRSDVGGPRPPLVRRIEIPDSVNVIATDLMAVLKGSRSPVLTREFLRFVNSEPGRGVLRRHGFETDRATDVAND